MAEVRHFTYESADGRTKIHAIEWMPEGEVKGIVQIVHGMQEYIERYDEFAKWMCERGFLVVGNDHLGHGASVRSKARRGYFAKKDPDLVLLQDIQSLQKMTQERYPKAVYIILGHSMGSFLTRQYLCEYGQDLDGAIISGTAYHPYVEALAGTLLCRFLARRKGWMYRSAFVNRLATGNFNKKFEPARTPSDWLTREASIVDEFTNDERSQFMFTVNAYFGMFSALKYLTKRKNLTKMDPSLPVFFIAGEMDPVGNFGVGVKKVVMQFQSAGMRSVVCRIYPNDRHEVLNEIDRYEVYADILNWQKKNVPAGGRQKEE